METIASVAEMQSWSGLSRSRGKRIGFVPTMGYLHDGHISLVRLARSRCDTVVASIFVNPMQFGANEDLDKYPRDLERDTKMLTDANTDVLFLPTAAEMYPAGYQTSVEVETLTRGLCGITRPTHFRGVTTVVAKLFNMVQPHLAVFGEKDFQQLAAIRRMVTDLNFPIEIVGGPIVREPDGLAMSSRNKYLNPEERTAALCLSRALSDTRTRIARGEASTQVLREAVVAAIAAEPHARLDYAEFVDADSLEAVDSIASPTVLALAVFVGRTRLIDNSVFYPPAAADRRG